MNLSVIILTKNEENNIKECLSCLDFCDEVIVVDDNSSDKTISLARKLGAKIYERKLGDDFAAQRNFGLNKAQGKWVMFIDADERVTENLRNEIVQITNDPLVGCLGLYFKREDCLWGKKLKHGETANVKLLRLARRKVGKWRRRVHETWEIEGRTRDLKNPLSHYPHPTFTDFINSVNTMSSLHARANLEEGKKSSLVKIIIWPIGKFIHNYIIRMGLLDGIQGFIVALVMSFHSYLSWSKLWFLQRKI